MSIVAANPYASCLGDRDPLTVLAETLEVLRRITTGWREHEFERTYAPGKWTARQILLHLVQTEMMFGVRARVAVNGDARQVQVYDQDAWVSREHDLATGSEVLAAFFGIRHVNLAFFRSLVPDELAIEIEHPERGVITVDWIVRTMAGHDLNHRGQLETIGGTPALPASAP